jgi:hypothetical protein
MAKNDLDQDIERAVNQYVEWATGLNITLSEDEIEAKRNELRREMGASELVPVDAGTREIESWDQVQELLASGDAAVIDDYQKLDDKHQLVNKPFIINRFWFTEGDMGEFVVARCLLRDKVLTPAGETDKVILTDGSTGIFKQLREVAKKTQRTTNIVVRHGLRVSQYTADTDSGPKMAETFYLT